MKHSSPIGIGTDIIEIDRIRKLLTKFGQRFIDRIFTRAEVEYCLQASDPAIRFAGRFAAKEAVAKALGTGIGALIGWKDLSIVTSRSGKPLHGTEGVAQATILAF